MTRSSVCGGAILASLALAATGCPPTSSTPVANQGGTSAKSGAAAGAAGKGVVLSKFARQLGFELKLGKGLGRSVKPAGSNHILQVLKGRTALCSINSGPYVPWLTKEDLKRWTKGAEWQTGPIKVEGLGEVSLEVESWAAVPKPRQLVLLAKGRLVRVIAKEWTPELGAVLSGITFVEGADRRTMYREKVGISPEEATRGVTPELALDLRGLHQKLGEDYAEFTNDVTKKGFQRFEAGKLDTLEALMLRDKLASALQKAVADRQTRPKEGDGDRYKQQHSSGATPGHGHGKAPPKAPKGP